MFHHLERDIRVLVHGDDYLTSGHGGDLDWMKSRLEDKYKIPTQHVGNGVDQISGGKILNRIVWWTPNGYVMEADQRHCELILERLDVENLEPLSTPGVEGKDEEDGKDDDELGKA